MFHKEFPNVELAGYNSDEEDSDKKVEEKK
jgi:hypothetical protein